MEDLSNAILQNNTDEIYNAHVTREEEAEPIPKLTPLTRGSNNPLTTGIITHVISLPDYPFSRKDGYTYCVSTEGMKDPEKIETQFCWKTLHPAKSQRLPFFKNIMGKKYKFQCTGVKRCEYASEILKTIEFEEATEELLGKVQEHAKSLTTQFSNQLKRNANSAFHATLKRFRLGKACSSHTDACSAGMTKWADPDLAGVFHYYLLCTASTPETRQQHYFRPIPSYGQIDVEYLKELFRNRADGNQRHECTVVEGTACRRPECGVDHAQGQGKLVHHKCDVVFHILRPDNMIETPFYLFTSHGKHTHPLPPPTKLPAAMISDIVNIIERVNNPNLTTARFLQSPELRQWCKEQNDKGTLAEVHKGWINRDRISALIFKQRLLLYPEGQAIQGVLFDQQMSHSNPETAYIQRVSNTGGNTFIICFLKAQAEILLKQDQFEVDMSFKRIKDRDLNEILFAKYLPEHNKIFTLGRIFMSSSLNNGDGYHYAFSAFFETVASVTRKEVQWFHIHGRGIKCVTADMAADQFNGLAQYLNSIDPEKRGPLWHIKKVVIFCRVHFIRGVKKVAGEGWTPLHDRLVSILTTTSRNDYYRILDLIQENESAEVRAWALHKRQEPIAAGLNRHNSLMDRDTYKEMRNHSDAVEQSGWKSNATVRKQKIRAAIEFSHIIDRTDVGMYHGREDYIILHSQRNTSMEARYERSVAKEKRKREKSHSSNSQASGSETSNQVLNLASSSGVYKKSSPQRILSSQADAISVSSQSESSAVSSRSYVIINAIQTRSEANGRRLSIRPTKVTAKSLAIQREEAELRKAEAEVRKANAEAHAQELANEQKELELTEKRQRIQDSLFRKYTTSE